MSAEREVGWLSTTLHYASWRFECGLVATGAARYGGACAHDAWEHLSQTRPPPPPIFSARRASRRGIRQIEAYLDLWNEGNK